MDEYSDSTGANGLVGCYRVDASRESSATSHEKEEHNRDTVRHNGYRRSDSSGGGGGEVGGKGARAESLAMKKSNTLFMVAFRLIRMITIPIGILFFEMYRKYYANFFFDDERLEKFVILNSDLSDHVFKTIKNATPEQLTKCQGIRIEFLVEKPQKTQEIEDAFPFDDEF